MKLKNLCCNDRFGFNGIATDAGLAVRKSMPAHKPSVVPRFCHGKRREGLRQAPRHPSSVCVGKSHLSLLHSMKIVIFSFTSVSKLKKLSFSFPSSMSVFMNMLTVSLLYDEDRDASEGLWNAMA